MVKASQRCALRPGVGAIVVGFAVTFLAPPARAHHSLDATHDLLKTVALTGVVSRVEWVNPHARLFLEVTSANGELARWFVELGAPNTMMKSGLGPAVLKPGDHVSVDVWRAKDGSLTASLHTLKLSDGRTFSTAAP